MIGIPDYSKATSLLCEDVVRVKHRADFAALGVRSAIAFFEFGGKVAPNSQLAGRRDFPR